MAQVESKENNVIISIKGMQSYTNVEDDSIELVTEGRLEESANGGYTLSYQESELTGLEGTLTTIQVEDHRVTLLRTGEVNSQMVFEEGRRHVSMYDTPYGALSVSIHTRRLRAAIGAEGGDLEVAYAIELDNATAGMNSFQVHVREKNRRPAAGQKQPR